MRPVAEVAKKHGISEQTHLYLAQALWHAGGCRRQEARQLEQENARLKKIVAERDLEIDVMKEIAAKKW